MGHRCRRLLFGIVTVAGALTACGGSSSETPPPLQPDPAGFRYASKPLPAQIVEDSDAGPAPLIAPEPADDAEPKPRAPARPTWGAGR